MSLQLRLQTSGWETRSLSLGRRSMCLGVGCSEVILVVFLQIWENDGVRNETIHSKDLAGETVTNVDIGGSSFMEHGRAEHMGIFSAVDCFAKFWMFLLMQYCKPLIFFPSCTKGMHYLHMEAPVKVIHRDLKSRNGKWPHRLTLLLYHSSLAPAWRFPWFCSSWLVYTLPWKHFHCQQISTTVCYLRRLPSVLCESNTGWSHLDLLVRLVSFACLVWFCFFLE